VEASTDGWQRLKRLRTHEQVLDAIETQILTGHLRPGDRLPSERELALVLGVSRPSVREALRVLEWMGVIVAGVGSGKDAGSIIADRISDALSRVLRVHLALANVSLDHVVETRVSLEATAVVGAAQHATTSDLRKLGDIVQRMNGDDPSLTPDRFNELDTDFHVAVAEASGNKLLAEMMQALRDVVRQEMVRAFERLDDWRESARAIQSEHRAILDMIAARDPAGAQERMTDHITSFYAKARPRPELDEESLDRHHAVGRPT
jgi:DNA-binding FadR family transcriptional regulator